MKEAVHARLQHYEEEMSEATGLVYRCLEPVAKKAVKAAISELRVKGDKDAVATLNIPMVAAQMSMMVANNLLTYAMLQVAVNPEETIGIEEEDDDERSYAMYHVQNTILEQHMEAAINIMRESKKGWFSLRDQAAHAQSCVKCMASMFKDFNVLENYMKRPCQ